MSGSYYKNEMKCIKLQHDHLNCETHVWIIIKDLETINYIPVTITMRRLFFFFKECRPFSLCYQLILVVHAKCRSVITL